MLLSALLLTCSTSFAQTRPARDAVSLTGSQVAPIGTITAFAGPASAVPANWKICNGEELGRDEYPKLFAVIGTAWGGRIVAGEQFFSLPDLRGMFLRGVTGDVAIDPEVNNRYSKIQGGNASGVGSFEKDAFERHQHKRNDQSMNEILLRVGGNGAGLPDGGSSQFRPHESTDFAGESTETRPKNAFVYYIIKWND